MARFPKFALTLAFVATPFFGYDDWFNIPDPTGPDAAVFNLRSARPTLAPDSSGIGIEQAGPWHPQPTRLMPAVASPTGARGTSLSVYRQRPAARHDGRAVATHQYVWFVDDSGPSKVADRLVAGSWAKRAAANGSLRLSLPGRDSAPGTRSVAASFPALHLTCFRRGA